MILLSVIGTSDYKETIYEWNGKKSGKVQFIIHALSEFFPFEKILVLMTEDSKKKYYEKLQALPSFKCIPIPEGRNESDLWEIFEKIASSIPEKNELVIDVTHGFRSLPMLTLAVAVYLKVTKKVSIRHIFYGAYEARNQKTDVTPVFELTSFLDIISWSFATDYFIKMGKAEQLKQLTGEIQDTWYRERKDYKPKGLKNLGNKLARLSDALSVVRTSEVLDLATELPEEIEQSKKDVENIPQARPLASLLDQMADTFKEMIVSKENNEDLKAQAAIVQYYLDTGQYQQAITLARELLVSAVCLLLKHDMIEIENRKSAECILNRKNTEPLPSWLTPDKIDYVEDMIKLWEGFSDLRNDINHAGMRTNPSTTEAFISNIKDNCSKVIECISHYPN